MRGLERAGDLDRQPERFVRRDRTAQGLTLEILEHQIVRAHVVHLADVGRVERRDRARFPLKPLAVLRRELFDRDDAIETRVARPVHLAHAACAQGRLDFVRAETGAGR